jgi:Flp pilus assembly protein TadG
MPIVLILVMGVIDFGRLLNAKITLTQAAREGVRVVALNKPNPTDKAASAALPALSGVSATVLVSCPTGSAGTKSGELQTSYTFSFVTPVGDLVGMFGGGGFGSPVTLSAKGVMLCES